STWEPVMEPVCCRSSMPLKRRADTRLLIKLRRAVQEILPPAMLMRARQRNCFIGKQPEPSRRCVRAAGTLFLKIQTAWNNMSKEGGRNPPSFIKDGKFWNRLFRFIRQGILLKKFT